MNHRLLSETELFRGRSEQEIRQMLNCLKHDVKSFPKGSFIYRSGQTVRDVCLVLSGCVQIETVDILGNRSILGFARAGEIFAESYACLPEQPILVDVFAAEDSEILCIDMPGLFAKSDSCEYGAGLLKSLLQISSRKNLNLSMRILHSAPKTIRARLFSYFSEQTALHGSGDFTIPLDRQQLADYLGVERTALSRELGKMRDEGLLTFRKNEFHLRIPI